KKRTCRFETWLGFFDGKKLKVFKGESKGTVAGLEKGKTALKLPYDLIFIPSGDTRTYAEMTPQEKAATSHRVKAFKAFAKGMQA
ncbi:MAG: non-canonical purine NTP pyrophosphatase, partial [Candidatus Micrarchaeota archaeon]|nr:non-canonical purine NTP pyrophosphatase [Candidatus Micrarchaeota archaeon]